MTTTPESNEPRVERVLVTPDMAKNFLDRNVENNRRLRPTKISEYAHDMASKKWKLDGSTIKFNKAGKMFDGQNRCHACVLADTPFETFVAYGLDEDAVDVTDTGAPRQFRDVAGFHGLDSRPQLAAIVRRTWMWMRGNYTAASGGFGEMEHIYRRPTHSEMLEFYRGSPELFTAATDRAADIRRARVGNATAAGVAFILFETTAGRDTAHTFFDALASGANLPPNHPIWVLRERLIRSNHTATEQLALYMRAWNAWRKDKPIDSGRLQITRGGLNNTNFPQPI